MSMHIACSGYTGEQKMISTSVNSSNSSDDFETNLNESFMRNKFLKPGESPVSV